jgi:glycosyltransferase involved in cell wall biosynthesis
VLKNWSPALLCRAEELLALGGFDAIHFNHLDTACFVHGRQWPQKKVFDSHNCLSALARQVSHEQSGAFRRAIYEREASRLSKLERQVCSRMDITLACSNEDAQAFRNLGADGRFVIAPNGVDTTFFSPSKSPEEPGNVVFTGAMNYYPNEQGALHFCKNILPLLDGCSPAVRVYLVGKSPGSAVRSLHDGVSTIVTGRVDDVRPYVDRSQVVVVPLLHGSGTRLKILEAFSMGKAVVSTSQGAEGIPAVDGEQILLADDPAEFAAKVRRLLESPELRTTIGRAAQGLVQKQFDWSRVNDLILRSYESVA